MLLRRVPDCEAHTSRMRRTRTAQCIPCQQRKGSFVIYGAFYGHDCKAAVLNQPGGLNKSARAPTKSACNSTTSYARLHSGAVVLLAAVYMKHALFLLLVYAALLAIAGRVQPIQRCRGGEIEYFC